MATKVPVAEVLFDSLDPNLFKIVAFEWPQLVGIPLFDLEVSLKIQNKFFVGRCTAFEENLALEKATTEALERILFGLYEIPLDAGTALHPDFEVASRLARMELFERDAFLSHFLLKIHGKEIPVPNELVCLLLPFEKKGVRFLLRRLSSADHASEVVLCAASGEGFKEPFGIVVGLGCATRIEEALLKSLLEVLPRLAYVTLGDFLPIQAVEDFRGVSSGDHFHQALPASYRPDFLFGIGNNQIENNFIPNVSMQSFQVDLSQLLGFALPELHFAWAQSEDLQGLFRGPSTGQNINFRRLGLKSGELWRIEALPHPLG